MYCVRLALDGRSDHFLHMQIRLCRGRVTDVHRGISHEYMMSKAVRRTVYCSSRDLPVPAGMHDPDSGHTTVGDQYFMDFLCHFVYPQTGASSILT